MDTSRKIIYLVISIALLASLIYLLISGYWSLDDWRYSEPTEFPSWLLILVGFVAAISLIIYFIRKRSTKTKIIVVAVIIAILIFGYIGFLFQSSNFASLGVSGLGYSVGGAKDINNFRENIQNNYLPIPTDITYEGLFYDYYFDTGEKEQCSKLFCPSYTYAISKDPFSKYKEYYLSVGLNSNIKESDFNRKKLNLVIVLDISGSMSSTFNRYYYDRFGGRTSIEENYTEEDYSKSKMQVAKESIVALLDHLNSDDRLGIVLFDDQAYLAKTLNFVGNTNMERIKQHILEINPRGGTQMSAGIKMGSELFERFEGSGQSEYENRIIFLTDAMPNLGETSEEGLLGKTKRNSENKIYTTFIGIGVDFNTELIEAITKVRGANYYSVHSARQFKERMDDEFEYMVTPLIFNLVLNLDAKGYEIVKVYGSPEADEATGTIMKVNTLFPSKKEGVETRGGLILLKLRKLSNNSDMKLKISYEDRAGKVSSDEVVVNIEEKEPDFFENTGIRKGILLARYADLMKNWVNDERQSYGNEEVIIPSVTKETGIIVPEDIELGKWERQSIPLRVSNSYKMLIQEFTEHFKKEMVAIGDETLTKELTILEKLSN